MAIRAPHLYSSLRCFCLGAFKALADELDAGAELPFAFEEHASAGGPALYEYRPLVRGFVEQHAGRLRALPDTQLVLDDLHREPTAAIYARAHAGAGPTEDDALFRTVLLPIAAMTADRCGGFDWHDDAFDRAYAELERSLFGTRRSYVAVAPLVGISVGAHVELGDGVRVRVSATGELSTLWPEAQGLLPERFGREPDRLCMIELARELDAGEPEPPDAPGELADAVTAIRLVTSGAIAAGPVIFERLDRRPLGIRPVLPIAATGRSARRRGWTRFGPSSSPRSAAGCPTPTAIRSWQRRSTAGSCRSSSRTPSGATSCASRSSRSSASARGRGRRPCALRPCSPSRRRSAPTCSSGSAATTPTPRRTGSAAPSSRR